jgi:hypothetical protein
VKKCQIFGALIPVYEALITIEKAMEGKQDKKC